MDAWLYREGGRGGPTEWVRSPFRVFAGALLLVALGVSAAHSHETHVHDQEAPETCVVCHLVDLSGADPGTTPDLDSGRVASDQIPSFHEQAFPSCPGHAATLPRAPPLPG